MPVKAPPIPKINLPSKSVCSIYLREIMNTAESLRSLENLTRPDPRRKGGSIEYLHSMLEKLKLNKNVPEGITIQFETAKNLFLYSWFVHRFHHVADLHALTTLELALKTRFDELEIEYWSKANLWKYLSKAEKNGLITKEDVPGYYEYAKHKAKERHLYKNLQRMIEENLTELEYDESKVLLEEDDFNPNHLSDTFNSLYDLRNDFAHGTTALLTPNFGILNLTKSLINAIYKSR